MFKLADRIKPIEDPEEVTAIACELLRTYLGAERVFYGEVDETGEFINVRRDWTGGNLPSMAGRRLALNDFGPSIIDAVRAGLVIAVDDVTADERCVSYAHAYLANGVRSFLAIPLLKRDLLRATLNIHRSDVHHWPDLEIAMADDLVDRTWFALENAQAQAKLRIEHDRSQAVFDTMTEGFGIINGDWTVLYMNAEGLRLSGRTAQQVVGRNHWQTWSELAGSDVEALYRRVIEARQDVFDYIEMFYDPKRRHSFSNNMSPVEYEKQYFQWLGSV